MCLFHDFHLIALPLVRDEKDVKNVLVRQKDNLDTQYLKKRARDAGVLKVLETINQL